jgi:hypothetical protein
MEEKKLRCKMSTFKTDMTFNEWVRAYGVGSQYVEPTRYFTGMRNLSIDTKMELINFKPKETQDRSILSGIKESLKQIIYKNK